jgi:Mn2+/Fe2+ NRAMP family transporter
LILLGFLYDVVHAGAGPGGIVAGFAPGFADTESILLATGILGATVMPHVIYLHSAPTQNRIRPWNDRERRELLRFERLDVGLAMGIAGVVNMSMLIVAAALFHGVLDVASSTRRTGGSTRGWAAARPPPSGSRSWRRGSRARASARMPGRWSCRGSSGARSR